MFAWSERYHSLIIGENNGNFIKSHPLTFINSTDIRPLTPLEKNILNKVQKSVELGEGIFLLFSDRMFRKKVVFTKDKILEFKITKDGVKITTFLKGRIQGVDKKNLIKANRKRLKNLTKFSLSIVKNAFKKFGKEAVISFSGGKDSLVLSHLLRKYNIPNVYIDTGMEFPETYNYIQELKKMGWKIFVIKPKFSWKTLEKKFGKPSYSNRWCSKFLKFEPFKKFLLSNFGKKSVLVFSAERRWESISRINQPYIKQQKHIENEIVVQPILDWFELDVWIYIWTKKLYVNPLYEKIPRNGCWVCPFGWKYRKFLLKYSHPELLTTHHISP